MRVWGHQTLPGWWRRYEGIIYKVERILIAVVQGLLCPSVCYLGQLAVGRTDDMSYLCGHQTTALMKKLTLILLLGLWGMVSAFGSAASDMQYYFVNFDITNGLSQNSVLAILQDRKGFLWFGTKDGLNRYDGISFRVFKQDGRHGGGPGNNYITELHEDRQGRIWIGTDAGLYVYCPEKDLFSRFSLKSRENTTVDNMVRTIVEDPRGRVWASVERQGLFCYDPERDELRNYMPEHYVPALSANVESLAFDNSGKLWIGFYGQGLYCSDDDMQTMHPYVSDSGVEMFHNDVITKIVPGSYNCLYISSLKYGVQELNLTSDHLTTLLREDEGGEMLFVRELLVDGNNELWIGTETGLYIYNLNSRTFRHLKSIGGDPFSLADNAIYSLYRDREGGIWVGTYFGGVDYYPRPCTYFDKYYPGGNGGGLRGKRVREFCRDNQGMVWIGTEDGGLTRFDPSAKTFSFFEPSQSFRNVHGLCMVGDRLWVGTFSKGLKVIDPRTGTVVKSYVKTDSPRSLADNSVFSICHTSSGEVYLGTLFGLQRYCPQTDDFEHIPELEGTFIYQVKETSDGNLWLATYANGVYCYDVGRNQWKNYVHHSADTTSLSYNKVLGVFEDSRRRLWFSTQGGGLCRFHPDTGTFTTYGLADGLPNDVVYQIVEDAEGMLWFTTNDGLVHFDPNDGKVIKTYTTANGLLSNQFNYCSAFRDSDGTIYFGCIEGFVAFNPKTFTENSFLPTPVITDFMLFNKEMYARTEGSPLERSIIYSDRVELKAGQNSFSFRIAALGFEASRMNGLQYKLDGFDADWLTADESRIAGYSNLKSGHYVFRVRASNSDGLWNPDECRLHIHILPPFYLSPWAYVVYALLLTACSAYALMYYRRRTRRKQRMQADKFEREKEREIYRAKIDFFTNVAHEVRTPLTLIKGPLENILQRKQVDADTREDLCIMQQNTERLLHLTNQLLDFRKTETKGYRLNFAECDIVRIVKNTYLRFTTLARQKGLELSLDVPEEGVHAHVNEEAFTKILSNLLNNGVKYAGSYLHMILTVDTERHTFSVRTENDGSVVPLSLREEIFQPFVRFDGKDGKGVGNGTGIGLALARSLAELHRGTLVMGPDADRNVFCLTMPTMQDLAITLSADQGEEAEGHAAAADVLPADSRPALADKGEETERGKILVVEDNPDMLSFVSRQLAHEYTVLTASNGKEALKALDRHYVKLVVSDVIMPVMDGFELCRHIKSTLAYSHIPVVLLTAKTNLQSKVAGLEIGADAYIEKPFSTEYLQATVHNLIGNRDKLRAAFTSSPFVAVNAMAQTQADEEFVKRLDEVIHANLSNADFSTDDMAESMGMSRSNFYRKIKGVLDLSPNEYLRIERLKYAAQLMKEGKDRVNEICYMVGFSSPSYFSKCFLKQFGVLPKDFLDGKM